MILRSYRYRLVKHKILLGVLKLIHHFIIYSRASLKVALLPALEIISLIQINFIKPLYLSFLLSL
jgi:hypothetical protein